VSPQHSELKVVCTLILPAPDFTFHSLWTKVHELTPCIFFRSWYLLTRSGNEIPWP